MHKEIPCGHLISHFRFSAALRLFAAFCGLIACEREHPRAQSIALKDPPPSLSTPDSGMPPAGTSIVALAGNVDIENRFQQTVIVTPLLSSLKGGKKECSGVLISPQAVLTAGHCFCAGRKAEPAEPESSFVIDGSECATTAIVTTLIYTKSEQGSETAYQTKDYQGTIRLHPGFKVILDKEGSVTSSTGDLAVISLATPVDAGLPPLSFAKTEVQLNEPVILVGYGYDEGFGTLGGRRRYLKARVTSLPGSSEDRTLVEKTAQTRYRGDSGGPCLREAAQGLELIGILSRGLGHEPSFTNIHPHEHWLRKELQRASFPEKATPR